MAPLAERLPALMVPGSVVPDWPDRSAARRGVRAVSGLGSTVPKTVGAVVPTKKNARA
jgi:hypothetical protein